MLGDISVVDDIYIVCGYTDMRKQIDDRENLRMKKSKKSPILLGILPFLWYNENSKKRSFIP